MTDKSAKKCIILSAGECPKKRIFSKFSEKFGYNTLFCADGGFANAQRLGVIPDYVIGDMDSIEQGVLQKESKLTKIIRLARQSDTDTEKCLKFAIARKYTRIIIMGADGGRLDHLLSVMGLLLKYAEIISIAFVSNNSVIHPAVNKIEFSAAVGEIISCFSLNDTAEFQSKGLKYPLKGTGFLLGKKESISNRATSNRIEISSTAGKFFIVRSIKSAIDEMLFYEH